MIFRLGFGPRIRLTHKIKINSLLSAESRIFLGGIVPEKRPEKIKRIFNQKTRIKVKKARF